VGYIAIVPIRKGEQITYSQLSEPSMRTGLSPQIAPGKRAVSLAINDVTGVSKLLKPGDRIDVIAVTGKEAKVAKTVLQDMVVLAAGRAVTNNVPRTVELDVASNKEKVKSLVEDYSYATITLEADPGQAQIVALLGADHDTIPVIVLRNNDDNERANTNGVMVQDLLGQDAFRLRAPAGGR
jgi:pilus assembly protein CpaB